MLVYRDEYLKNTNSKYFSNSHHDTTLCRSFLLSIISRSQKMLNGLCTFYRSTVLPFRLCLYQDDAR